MSRTRLTLALGAAALAGIGAWFAMGSGPSEPSEALPASENSPSAKPPSEPEPASAPEPENAAAEDKRQLLPRKPSRPRVTHVSAPKTEAASEEAPGVAEAGDELVLASKESIQATVQEVVPGVKECLEGWWELEPELEGRVVLQFELTQEGLGEVYVLEHDGVPFGVQTCFSTALYEADWPVPEGEGSLTVNYPFAFDNGPDSG